MNETKTPCDIPESWVWTTLGEIGVVASGNTPSTNVEEYFGGNIPWLCPSDLSDYNGKYIERGKRNLTKEGLNSSSARLLPKGTILFSSRAPIGYAVIASNPIATNQGFKNLILPEEIFNEYVYHYLKGNKRLAESYASGTTFKELSATRFRRIPIPIPPFPEQKRIVFKLEELFSKLDAAVKSLKRTKIQLRLYQQSLLKNAFEGGLTAAWSSEKKHQKLQVPSRNLIEKSYEYIRSKRKKSGKRVYKTLPKIDEEALPELPNAWVWARAEELTYVIDYRGRTPPYSPEGIPHLRSSNIKDGKIIWEDLRYVSEETYEKFMVRGISQQGDLLFTTEAPLGEVAFVPNSKFSLAQRLMILRPNNSILDSRFLFYQIISPRFQGRLKGRGTGTTVTGVSYRNFRLLELAVPPLEEQHIIADELDIGFSSISRITEEVEQALRRSSIMKQGILRKAFEGDLVPQDPSEEPADQLLERIKEAKKNLERGMEQPRLDKW